ncbi:MAG: 4Fe-4S binding protein [Deltaproteobacteria bacterium]|nr:4Fe-4S binding protein [Deltaproteobacteria bacterium]MBW2284025.1 4Fe-4S binding protein [Deltaproteobacteria bacterium]
MDPKYKELATRIGLGESERIPRLFSMIADDKEAELLLNLPADAPTLSEKLDFPREEVEDMIQTLFIKGLVFPSFKSDPPKYRMGRDFIQFHDATILWPDAPKPFLDLWQEWTEEEWPDMARAIEKISPKPGMRIIPVGITVKAQGQVLGFEDVADIINNSRELAVANCTCRLTAHKCDKTLEACIQVNNAASYAIARGTGRKLTKEEALELCRKFEEEGLIHTTFNARSVDHIICNCCGCCCQFLPEHIKHGIRVVDPSRFRAEIDADECSGCETCVDRCYFNAIAMEDETAVVDLDACMGCGVCAVTCPDEAISMIEVREPDHVPEKFSFH